MRRILLFEEKSKKEKESKVKGPPPKKTLDELLNSGTKWKTIIMNYYFIVCNQLPINYESFRIFFLS